MDGEERHSVSKRPEWGKIITCRRTSQILGEESTRNFGSTSTEDATRKGASEDRSANTRNGRGTDRLICPEVGTE